MGSVKEVDIKIPAEASKTGEGLFTFSDRYSVFDWGEMPDHIDHKGASLAALSSYFFNLLEEKGIITHFIGLEEGGKIKKFPELTKPSNIMKVKVVRVLKPPYNKETNKYDYSAYKNEKKNFLIPLEIIYRNKLTEGSSVFKRIKSGQTTFKDLGLDHDPKPGETLDKPILDVSTKLEHTDRYISWPEAQQISGLSDADMEKAKKMILDINNIITEACSSVGIENVDGKFEFAMDPEGNIIVVDVLGTPDECRFLADGFHISKEICRRWYRKTEWADEVEKAKKERGNDWKKYVKAPPPRLPAEMKTLVSQMYMAVTNEISVKKLFDVPELKKIIEELKKYDK